MILNTLPQSAGNIPSGLIAMWSGTTVPDGWVLCNGENGTPDLRGRFVLAANDGEELMSTGGEAEHTLTTAELPAHSHAATCASAGNHNHSYTSVNFRTQESGSGALNTAYHGGSQNTSNGGAHTHVITVDDTGEGAAHNNMPPYLILAYIMKI